MALPEVEPAEPRAARSLAPPERTTPLVWIWTLGIALHLVLMPFTLNIDAYRIYSRANEAVSTGDWFGWGSQFVIQLVHNVWFAVIRPLLPGGADIWSVSAATMGVGAQPEEYARFLDYRYLARALFLMKLPYLAADVAVGWLLTRLVDVARRPRVLALWLLNPIVIFVSVVFSRHDSISVALVMLSLYAAVRGRRVAGLLLLGVGAAARFFPVFLAPFYLLAFSRSRREALVFTSGLAGLWLLVEIVVQIGGGASPTFTLLNGYPHVSYLVDIAFGTDVGSAVYLFPLAYGLLFLFALDRHWQDASSYVPLAATAMLVFFSLTFFHPQYTIWLVPFLALTIDRDARLLGLHAAQVVLIGLLSFRFGPTTSWDLLAPLHAAAIDHLPEPMAIVNALVPANLFLGVVRSLFIAISLWMGFAVLREYRARRPASNAQGGAR